MNAGAPGAITEVYPRYSQRLLRVLLADYEEAMIEYLGKSNRRGYKLNEMFEHEPITFVINPDDVFISGSLFFKGASFAKRNAHPAHDSSGQIPLSEVHRVPHPAFASSTRENRSFFDNYVKPLIESKWEGYQVVIFLACDLLCLHDILQDHGIHVVMMKHTSIAHNPGAMWRFLALNFNCQAVYCTDTDSPVQLSRLERFSDILQQDPKTALVRQLQATGKGPNMEMSLILAGSFMAKPSLVDFNMAESLLGYVILNLLTEDRPATFVHENRHGRPYFMPRFDDVDYCGPKPSEKVIRKCFPYYGFDEQWLKEVAYFHFSNGRMATLVQGRNEADLWQSLDILYQEENGNRLIWPE
jgi:hypothetical protein